jgi:excisionase family DNA binding protein
MATQTEINEPISVKFEDMLKPQDAARRLGISKSHLRELTAAGRVPALDVGIASKRVWRYHAPTLDAWLQKKMNDSLVPKR